MFFASMGYTIVLFIFFVLFCCVIAISLDINSLFYKKYAKANPTFIKQLLPAQKKFVV